MRNWCNNVFVPCFQMRDCQITDVIFYILAWWSKYPNMCVIHRSLCSTNDQNPQPFIAQLTLLLSPLEIEIETKKNAAKIRKRNTKQAPVKVCLTHQQLHFDSYTCCWYCWIKVYLRNYVHVSDFLSRAWDFFVKQVNTSPFISLIWIYIFLDWEAYRNCVYHCGWRSNHSYPQQTCAPGW